MTAEALRAKSFESVLRSRRMCRNFLPEPVSTDLRDTVVAAAFRGPSAGNTQGLELVVLSGEDVGRYWDTTLPEPARGEFRWPGLLNAPELIIPVVQPGAYVSRYGRADKLHSGLGRSEEDWTVPYWFVDGGAAVMAMLLAAEAAGLGALFFGQFDHEAQLRRTFGIPDGYRNLGTLALGYAAPGGRNPSASVRNSAPSLDDLIHHGTW